MQKIIKMIPLLLLLCHITSNGIFWRQSSSLHVGFCGAMMAITVAALVRLLHATIKIVHGFLSLVALNFVS